MSKKVRVIVIILLMVSLVGNGYAIYINQQQGNMLDKMKNLQQQQLQIDKKQTREIGNLTNRQLDIAKTMQKIADYVY